MQKSSGGSEGAEFEAYTIPEWIIISRIILRAIERLRLGLGKICIRMGWRRMDAVTGIAGYWEMLGRVRHVDVSERVVNWGNCMAIKS